LNSNECQTLRKNDWDHKQLGETEGEIRDTLREILENPSEVYEGTRTNDDATVRVYVNEMTLNGNEVVAFLLVVDGEAISSFVPAGQAPETSDYDSVYDREEAIEYIKEEVLKTSTGEDPIRKILQDEEIIEDIDEGEEFP